MYRQGEIVLIPVPFTDLSVTKRRPVLIVSNNKYNMECPDIIVVAITSSLLHVGIPIRNDDMTSGQLPKPSIIRSDKIYTLNQSIVIKSIGSVSMAIRNSVNHTIYKLIGFDSTSQPCATL